jgi:hypothetical protein
MGDNDCVLDIPVKDNESEKRGYKLGEVRGLKGVKKEESKVAKGTVRKIITLPVK